MVPVSNTGHQTSKAALRVLLELDRGYHVPTRAERDALLVGFAMHRKLLYGAGYDILLLSRPVDLADPQAIAGNMDAIAVREVKSTNRASVKADLKGYFFNITAAELLVAQSLGLQYRFSFVHTVRREHHELTLQEVLGRSLATYPAWHIRF